MELKTSEEILSGKMKTGLKIFGIVSILCVIVFFVLAEIASRGAARIFNREMEKQNMLRGTITAEKIMAHINGDVVFENLLWVEPDGDVILRVPEGSFHARPWDVITRNFKSTTIQKLELHNAVISVAFDEDMQVDFLEQKNLGLNSIGEQAPVATKEVPESGEEANFNRDGRKLRVEVVLNNCRLEARYRQRHYVMNNVNMKMELNTSGVSQIDLSTGKFGGTMRGGGMSIAGTVDFKSETPEADIDVSIRDVDPASLGFGMKLHDLMTVVAKLTGPVTGPKGRGTVRMKELTIPALHFTDVIGDVAYSDGLFRFTDVHAKIFGGKLNARGDYNLDTRRYNIYGKGMELDSRRALNDLQFSCLVDMQLTVRCDGNPRNILAYGDFKSGKGRYILIPFDSVEGRFTNRFKELFIYDAKITTQFGTITTDAFSIIKGKLTLGPVILTDPDTGEVIPIKVKKGKENG